MAIESNQDWKPRLRGRIYCSPACGSRCTHAAFIRATNNAHDLAASLGKGWKPVVWENLGWQYNVVHKATKMEVAPMDKRGRRYWASVRLVEQQIEPYSCEADTPRDAVIGVAKIMREERMLIDRCLQELYPISNIN